MIGSNCLADRPRPPQPLEADVRGEIASAISLAYDSNWSLQYLEEQIKEHKGDVTAIFHEVGISMLQSCCFVSLCIAVHG